MAAKPEWSQSPIFISAGDVSCLYPFHLSRKAVSVDLQSSDSAAYFDLLRIGAAAEPSHVGRHLDRRVLVDSFRGFPETAEVATDGGLTRHEVSSGEYGTTRVSPGGPDPQHHFEIHAMNSSDPQHHFEIHAMNSSDPQHHFEIPL
ncbi:hypothetical protein ACLOJK_010457 [Asimina triloba]